MMNGFNEFRNYFTLTVNRCKKCNVVIGRGRKYCDKCKLENKMKENEVSEKEIKGE